GAQPLALDESVENLALVQMGELGRASRQFLERLLLARRLQARQDALRPYQVDDVHVSRLSSPVPLVVAHPSFSPLVVSICGVAHRIDPADVPIAAPIDHVEAAMRAVLEQE